MEESLRSNIVRLFFYLMLDLSFRLGNKVKTEDEINTSYLAHERCRWGAFNHPENKSTAMDQGTGAVSG